MIFRSPKNLVEQTRFNKKTALITESLESYQVEQEDDCSVEYGSNEIFDFAHKHSQKAYRKF